ncbi:unnamed protein product [Rotaria magnacalcarata]|uniref:Ionotropic glutamate receptor C-terminal domain-containing protein n=1 Tax=Rotaria magnacalcarata TaxID=392030 RepID=A0A819AM41_9BILA|nr:unnamed protein product [Rotaria magnacalcarata]CAF3786953.1 unnamed protein product [Rotaria magnacalcarata]CAF3808520.1 unnamed protein product [Rotaria magnacalcarata]
MVLITLQKKAQITSNGLTLVSILDYTDPGDWRVPAQENVIIWPGNPWIKPTDRAVLKASSNQTYAALVQAISNGDYDNVIGDVTVISSRREIVSFSIGILDNSLSIIILQSFNVDIDLLSFLKPFSRSLWLLVLIAFVYAGILMCMFERHDNEALQNRSLVSQLSMSLWFSFGNMVGYGADFHANTASGRLITAGLFILCLMLVASYTANLASDLIISKSQGTISGIDDIKSGKIPFNRVGVRVGTASEDYYLREEIEIIIH